MNDQNFRDKVINDLAEIKTEIKNGSFERHEIKKEVKAIQEFINKAKGGWITLGFLSAFISGITAYIISAVKSFK